METISVQLGSRSYPVCLGSDLSERFPAYVKEMFPGRRLALITNTTLAALYKETIERWEKELSFFKVVIPDGEKYKTVSTWESVLDSLLSIRLDRTAVIIAFGGGVVGDIAGFAAACYLRGVTCVQVPTTLLAMVDSSVGGKTGVNHQSGKNLIGAFHQPSLVWVDTALLNTLPSREFIAGYAELFKYAFIGGPDMFSFVRSHHAAMMTKKNEILVEGIRRGIVIKARVVGEDEREETGARAALNFGHTFAHSLERFFHFSGIMHGEAVLWGMACACDLGLRAGTIPETDREAYTALCKKLPCVALPAKPDIETLYAGMFTDKKTMHGSLRFIVPTRPGFSVMKNDISRQDVLDTLEAVFSHRG
ncbi:MAG TPA: 3-dehydroquinate synthase [Chitinivibrionales bacterium]